MQSRLLWLDDREFNPEAIINDSMAQHYLWRAQALRDRNQISDAEMAKMEGMLSSRARAARTMFNPFTGEVRHIDSNGEVSTPTTVFLGGAK